MFLKEKEIVAEILANVREVTIRRRLTALVPS
jgi:hypothetical protein